jgi:hypothetical protein
MACILEVHFLLLALSRLNDLDVLRSFFIRILMCDYCRCSSVITFLSNFVISVLHQRVPMRISENNFDIDSMEIQ